MKRRKLVFKKLVAALTLGSVLATGAAGVFAEDNGISIDSVNFPDDAFRERIAMYADADENGVLTEDEIAKTTRLELDGLNIKDVSGIEFFTELVHLSCTQNNLTNVDFSSNTKLESLYCGANKIRTLDVSANTGLVNLDCSDNEIYRLDVSANDKLEFLYCYSNDLTEIDVTGNLALEDFSCAKNYLEVLDVSHNTKLTSLDCTDNKLDVIYVYEGITDEVFAGYRYDDYVGVIKGSPEDDESDQRITKGKGIYKILSEKKKTVAFVGVKNKKIKSFKVPGTIKTGGKKYKVVKIGKRAFSGCKKLKSLNIGKNVRNIGAQAFKNCPKLKEIKVMSKKLGKVGKNAIRGINKKAVIKVSKSKLKAYKKLFNKKTGYKKTMKLKAL